MHVFVILVLLGVVLRAIVRTLFRLGIICSIIQPTTEALLQVLASFCECFFCSQESSDVVAVACIDVGLPTRCLLPDQSGLLRRVGPDSETADQVSQSVTCLLLSLVFLLPLFDLFLDLFLLICEVSSRIAARVRLPEATPLVFAGIDCVNHHFCAWNGLEYLHCFKSNCSFGL